MKRSKLSGFEGEAGWRAAARIKVVLLAQAEIAKATMREKAKLPSSPAETDSKPIAEPESVPDAQSAATSPVQKMRSPLCAGFRASFGPIRMCAG